MTNSVLNATQLSLYIFGLDQKAFDGLLGDRIVFHVHSIIQQDGKETIQEDTVEGRAAVISFLATTHFNATKSITTESLHIEPTGPLDSVVTYTTFETKTDGSHYFYSGSFTVTFDGEGKATVINLKNTRILS